MVKKIIIGCGKGGVGKTLSSGILTMALAGKGYKVLVIDNEPQGNLTRILADTFGATDDDLEELDVNLYKGIVNEDLLGNAIVLHDNIHLVSGGKMLKGIEPYAIEKYGQAPELNRVVLKDVLEPIEESYDFVIIDTPPGWNFYSEIGLSCADYSLIVSTIKKDSVDGVVDFLDLSYEMIEQINPKLKILGIVPTIYEINKITKRFKNSKNYLLQMNEAVSPRNGHPTVFKNGIRRLERFDLYNEEGFSFIADPDNLMETAEPTRENPKKSLVEHHDKVAYNVLAKMTNEFLQRINDDKEGR